MTDKTCASCVKSGDLKKHEETQECDCVFDMTSQQRWCRRKGETCKTAAYVWPDCVCPDWQQKEEEE